MTKSDILDIEKALSIQLPEDYKKVMLAFPFTEDAGTINWSMWDRADKIIEWTKKYREGYSRAPNWESHMLLIGDEHDACPIMLNLKNGTVIKTNHGDTSLGPLNEYSSIKEFVSYLISIYEH